MVCGWFGCEIRGVGWWCGCSGWLGSDVFGIVGICYVFSYWCGCCWLDGFVGYCLKCVDDVFIVCVG